MAIQVYTGPIILAPGASYTIKAIAISADGSYSEVLVAVYNIIDQHGIHTKDGTIADIKNKDGNSIRIYNKQGN